MHFDDDKTLYQIVGKNVKKYRTWAGYTQSKFADVIGISLSYLTKIEAANCDKSFSLSLLNHIANTLHIDIIEFFKECD